MGGFKDRESSPPKAGDPADAIQKTLFQQTLKSYSEILSIFVAVVGEALVFKLLIIGRSQAFAARYEPDGSYLAYANF